MNILVIGDAARYSALEQKGLAGHRVHWIQELEPGEAPVLRNYELVIDLIFDDAPAHAAEYAREPAVPVLAGIVKTSLSAVMHRYAFEQGFNLIGCNWLPGFIERPVTETAILDEHQQPLLANIMQQLGWQYALVQDAVGMVTPRVVCMIINEAYLAAETGTASREDIDISMRLGTNYPYGPFEWAQQIGVRHVYEVLQAVHKATGDNRYEISGLLAAAAQEQ